MERKTYQEYFKAKPETESIEPHQTFTFSYKKRRRGTGRTSELVYHQ